LWGVKKGSQFFKIDYLRTKQYILKRRNFIQKAAGASAAFTIVPSHVLGFSTTSPNNKIQIGFIGVGRQGRGLMKNFVNYEEAAVVAVSDVDRLKMDLFEETYKETATKKGKTLSSITHFPTYSELLSQSDIDAVVIASPDHWHAQMAVDSAKVGKDIYCEKPLSSSVEEGRAMVNAARKYDVVFQTGSMQRSWRNFRHGVELIRNGYIGEIKAVHVCVGQPWKACELPAQPTPENIDWNAWIGPAPYRSYHRDLACPIDDDRWGMWRDYKPFGGGMITDWGAHMFDIVQWALDRDAGGPVQFTPPNHPAEIGLTFTYDDGLTVSHSRWGKGCNEIQFIGTEGRLEVSRSYLKTFPNASLAKEDLPSTATKRVYHSENHHLDWLQAIRDRTRPICDVEVGHRTATVCNIANIAYDLQRPLEWNPTTEKFVDDPSANLLLGRAYRGNWDYRNF
jgi:predicted dehydrogenase